METFLTVAVILAMIAIGVLFIELLNAQHNERMAAYRHEAGPPGRGGQDVPPEPIEAGARPWQTPMRRAHRRHLPRLRHRHLRIGHRYRLGHRFGTAGHRHHSHSGRPGRPA